MKSLRGKSGVLHLFSEVTESQDGRKVVDTCNTRIRECNVLGFYAKIIDVGAQSGELVGPSCTLEARELARFYGIELKITDEDS